jgi:hypothetical protein
MVHFLIIPSPFSGNNLFDDVKDVNICIKKNIAGYFTIIFLGSLYYEDILKN